VDLIKTHRSEDDQRLLYVAMTRARDRLYMPYFPDRDASDDDPFSITNDKDHGDYVAFQKITGPYRHVNQRLRALAADPARFAELFQVEAIPFPAPERAASPELAARLEAWSPSRPTAAGESAAQDDAEGPEPPNAEELARLRAERRGFFITSYSRLKDAEGGYQPPVLDEEDDDDATPALDELIAPEDGVERDSAAPTTGAAEAPEAGAPELARPAASDLPGGAATGLFLHGVLEKAALGPLPPLVEWERTPEVQGLLEAECRRWDRDPRHLGAAARMVHAALTASIALPGAKTPVAIATAARVRREVDFLFPVAPDSLRAPEVAGAAGPNGPCADDVGRVVLERGFIRGVLDVLFEHEGRACFADWKSDALPEFSAPAIEAHVAANYDLQIRIYTVAIVRLLGVRDEADYERRFGGLAYLFLRALDAEGGSAPGAGVFVGRPSYAQVRSWDHDLTRAPGAPLAGAHAPRPRRME
ncbi:MAG TPA: PD-(D/E)XK nuclease family protein, partial [Polyangia bacterium]